MRSLQEAAVLGQTINAPHRGIPIADEAVHGNAAVARPDGAGNLVRRTLVNAEVLSHVGAERAFLEIGLVRVGAGGNARPPVQPARHPTPQVNGKSATIRREVLLVI